jgi:hypothetical protein
MKTSISLAAVVCVLSCVASANAGGPKGGHSMSSSTMSAKNVLTSASTVNRVPVNTTILGSTSQSSSPEKGHGPVVLNPITTINGSPEKGHGPVVLQPVTPINGSPEKGHGPVVLNPTKPCQPTCGKDKCHHDFCNWFWYANWYFGGCGDYCYDSCYDDCGCYYW